MESNKYQWSTNDEVAAGVDVVLGVSVQVFLGDDRLDNLLHDILTKLFKGDLLTMLEFKTKHRNKLIQWYY